MAKKCIVCDSKAKFVIKGTNDFYCEECAKENFGDISVLVAVEEKASALKMVLEEEIDKKMNNQEEEIDPEKQFLEE